MSTPTIGLYVGADPPPALRALLFRLAQRYPVRDGGRSSDGLVAAVWFADPSPPPENVPVAIWISTEDDVAEVSSVLGSPRRPTILLTDSPALSRGRPDAVFVPAEDAGVPGSRPVSAFVRRRIRAARTIHGTPLAIAREGTWTWGDPPVAIGNDLAPTAAALAAAVVADATGVPLALAWGAATVTDPATAAALDATPDQDVLVASDLASRLEVAGKLTSDERRCAALGWAGRTLYERQLSLEHAVALVARRLALPASSSPLDALEDHLDELGTPKDAYVRARVASSTAGLALTTAGLV